ncbi:hypothetical protein [Streptosporangium canum]|uniref:hypothetical protein n=1 Tax=Streptosporangium canum TaxID=324952 RepID=UPI0037967EDD
MPQHYPQQTIHHIPKHKGWPNGEPSSVRDAYDKQLAEQASKKPAPKGGSK